MLGMRLREKSPRDERKLSCWLCAVDGGVERWLSAWSGGCPTVQGKRIQCQDHGKGKERKHGKQSQRLREQARRPCPICKLRFYLVLEVRLCGCRIAIKRGIPINSAMNPEKAKSLADNLKQKGEEGSRAARFQARQGRLGNFRKSFA